MLKEPEAAPEHGPSGQLSRRLVLSANILLAATALVWVVLVSPDIADPALPQVAGRLARGENYDPALLKRLLAENLKAAQQHCNAKTLRELLLLQIAVADQSARSTDLQQADIDIAAVDSVSRSLIECAPAESLGWLGMYWSSIRREGFGPKAATLLGQSYRLAPHEAWIQLIRAPLALRSYNALPPQLKDAAAQDFADIFRARLFPSAALLYKSATASAQTELLDRTCDSSESERLIFFHFVAESGLRVRHRCYPTDDRPAYMRE